MSSDILGGGGPGSPADMSPTELIQWLDGLYPDRADPNKTPHELAILSGQRSVIDRLAAELGVRITKEYTHVHR